MAPKKSLYPETYTYVYLGVLARPVCTMAPSTAGVHREGFEIVACNKLRGNMVQTGGTACQAAEHSFPSFLGRKIATSFHSSHFLPVGVLFCRHCTTLRERELLFFLPSPAPTMSSTSHASPSTNAPASARRRRGTTTGNPFVRGVRDNFPSLAVALADDLTVNDSRNDSRNDSADLDMSMDLSIDARAALHAHQRHVAKYGVDGEGNAHNNHSTHGTTLDQEWERILQGSPHQEGGADDDRASSFVSLPAWNRTHVLSSNEQDIEVAVMDITCIEGEGQADDFFNSSQVWQLLTPEKNRHRPMGGVTHRCDDDDEEDFSSNNDDTTPDEENHPPPQNSCLPEGEEVPQAARLPTRDFLHDLAAVDRDYYGMHNSLLATSIHEDLPLIQGADAVEHSFECSAIGLESPDTSFVLHNTSSATNMTPIRPVQASSAMRGSPTGSRRTSSSGTRHSGSRTSPWSSSRSSGSRRLSAGGLFGAMASPIRPDVSPLRRAFPTSRSHQACPFREASSFREALPSPIRPNNPQGSPFRVALGPIAPSSEVGRWTTSSLQPPDQATSAASSALPLSPLAQQAAQVAAQILQDYPSTRRGSSTPTPVFSGRRSSSGASDLRNSLREDSRALVDDVTQSSPETSFVDAPGSRRASSDHFRNSLREDSRALVDVTQSPETSFVGGEARTTPGGRRASSEADHFRDSLREDSRALVDLTQSPETSFVGGVGEDASWLPDENGHHEKVGRRFTTAADKALPGMAPPPADFPQERMLQEARQALLLLDRTSCLGGASDIEPLEDQRQPENTPQQATMDDSSVASHVKTGRVPQTPSEHSASGSPSPSTAHAAPHCSSKGALAASCETLRHLSSSALVSLDTTTSLRHDLTSSPRSTQSEDVYDRRIYRTVVPRRVFFPYQDPHDSFERPYAHSF